MRRPSSFSIGTCSAHVVCFVLYRRCVWHVRYDDGRYYRAPELILDRNLYGTPIDLWSYGCILAEICRGTPIFVGSDSVTQVRAVGGTLVPLRSQLALLASRWLCCWDLSAAASVSSLRFACHKLCL
jgi:hypothetical protein